MAHYSDLNQYAGEIPGVLIHGVRAVVQHLDNLVAIRPRELFFRPEIGMSLEPYLFQPVDFKTAFSIYATLSSSIRVFDSRVSVLGNRSSVVAVPADRRFNVNLILQINGIEDDYEYNNVMYSMFSKDRI